MHLLKFTEFSTLTFYKLAFIWFKIKAVRTSCYLGGKVLNGCVLTFYFGFSFYPNEKKVPLRHFTKRL